MLTEPSLALQTAIRLALIASPYITDLVPAGSIIDSRARPERFPCVIIGEGVTSLDDVTLARQHVRCVLDLHAWQTEPGLAGVKALAGAVRAVLSLGIGPVEDHDLVDFYVTTSRFLRDPAHEHSHAVITIEALLELQP